MNQSRLFTIYNKARVAARNGLLDEARVNKALGILQSNDYYSDKDYLTTLKSCTCPDHQFRGTTCKHMIAKMIETRMDQLAFAEMREMAKILNEYMKAA